MFKKINKKGFTLAELLIVVAIIGVLVAISIPIFTAQLRKARVATDEANARAAKAAFVAWYLDDANDSTKTLYYDAANGIAKDAATGIAAYGKTTDVKADEIEGARPDYSLTFYYGYGTPMYINMNGERFVNEDKNSYVMLDDTFLGNSKFLKQYTERMIYDIMHFRGRK